MHSNEFKKMIRNGQISYKKGKYVQNELLPEYKEMLEKENGVQKVRQSESRKKAVKAGFRSALEQKVSLMIDGFEYESIKLNYKKKSVKKLFCSECGGHDIYEIAAYTPDFIKDKLILEVKGRFIAADRKKMYSVKRDNPDYEIIMVLQNPTAKLSKKSKKTEADWCDENGFKWCHYKQVKLMIASIA